MKVSRILGVALIGLVTALGTGCGGDDEKTTTPEATTPTEPSAAAETTRVGMDEYSFQPGDVSVERGSTIDVENNGKIAHNLTLEKGPDPKKESDKLAGTSTFVSGESEKLEVDLKPGEYAMVCTVSGHRELGMIGTFTVK